MLDLTSRILNTAGLTGGAQCSAATERKDGHGGVSSLLLMVDFRGGPVKKNTLYNTRLFKPNSNP